MMMKRTIAILLACSVLPLFCGCRRNAEADYQRGIECMQKEEHEEAVKAFEESIRKAERVRDSHQQLAFYYERIGGHDLLALWHYEQAMKNTPKDAKEMPDIRAAVERNADAVLAHLQTVGRQEEQVAKSAVRKRYPFDGLWRPSVAGHSGIHRGASCRRCRKRRPHGQGERLALQSIPLHMDGHELSRRNAASRLSR